MLDIERAVCGCDYGGTSWTTRGEAGRVAELLELGPGKRLLDVGGGAGWPGLYLARTSGCDVTLVDIPEEGMRIAAGRAGADELPGDCWVAVADGGALPFKAGSFDAISHSDVLCCLEAKRTVLNACRQVIRREGRVVFTVVTIAPDLSPSQHDQAVEFGPPFVEARIGYSTMLREAGWDIIEHADLTAQYARSAQRLISETEERADELRAVLGEAEFSEMLAQRHASVRGIEEGLLRRELFAAEAVDAYPS